MPGRMETQVHSLEKPNPVWAWSGDENYNWYELSVMDETILSWG